MYIKVTEAAEEFVAIVDSDWLDWSPTKVQRAYIRLKRAVEEHQNENEEGGERNSDSSPT